MTADPEKIGRYRVIERVGSGGMGVLYRGVDPVLDREVAIKLMLADFSEDAEQQLRPRFYREARSAAKLQHRNIVTVFEFAEENGTPYIVMELLRGTSLADRMKASPALTLDDKLDVVAQLCAGLDYAHEQGVVHRDVKPANIFLLADGSIKLLDFGIAKVVTSTLTRFGDVVGSASYMSPEQVLGSDQIDGRADIFSTGIVLYELLAGRKPFEADAPTAVMMKIVQTDPPPIERLVPDLPAELVAVVNRALAKSPSDRFATAGQLERELQRIRKAPRLAATMVTAGPLRAAAIAPPPPVNFDPTLVAAAQSPAPAGRKWLVPAGIAGVVLVGVAIGAMTLGRGTPPVADRPPAANVQPAPPAGAPPAPVALATATAVPARPIAKAPDAAATTARPPAKTPGAAATTSAAAARRTPVLAALEASAAKPAPPQAPSPAVAAPVETPKPAAAPEAAMVAVSVSGPYRFQVFEGQQMISAASDVHELRVAPGRTVRLVAPEFLLNQSVRIDGGPGTHMNLRAPDLGKLTVRSTFETCMVTVSDHQLGYPPVNAVPVASGSYQIDLVCPNGQNQRGFATIAPGQSMVAKVP